jgi:hypothetical protein
MCLLKELPENHCLLFDCVFVVCRVILGCDGNAIATRGPRLRTAEDWGDLSVGVVGDLITGPLLRTAEDWGDLSVGVVGDRITGLALSLTTGSARRSTDILILQNKVWR